MKQIFVVFLVLLAAIGILYVVKFHPEVLHGDFSHIVPKTLMLQSIQRTNQHAPTITVRGHTFRLLFAKTPEEREKGLGQRDNLPQDEGMLFFFDTPDYQQFWMKGMRFPLDIIFIRNNNIVTIYQKIPNPSSPNSALEIFKSTEPADRVLEINAGLAETYHIQVGDEVTIAL